MTLALCRSLNQLGIRQRFYEAKKLLKKILLVVFFTVGLYHRKFKQLVRMKRHVDFDELPAS